MLVSTPAVISSASPFLFERELALVHHLVFFRFADTHAAQADRLVRELVGGLALLESVAVVRGGTNIRDVANGYDAAIMVEFHDRAALDRYLNDPGHRRAAEQILAASTSVASVDIEVATDRT